jgi:hypothetical protein
MTRILTCTVLALVLAAAVQAQEKLTGKWAGETKNGSHIVLDLTATETALTGTLTRNEQTSPIAEGKVSKNTFTFKATLGDQTEALTGELAGDQISVWLDRQGPASAVVLKRVKK